MACIALIFAGPGMIGLDTLTCTRICFIITSLWWLAFTIPLLRTYQQRFGKERDESVSVVVHNIKNTFKGLADTMRSIMHDRVLLVFMVAFSPCGGSPSPFRCCARISSALARSATRA